jgi:GTPase SAR1 family protein
MNKRERQEAETIGDVFFATYDMAHEALDLPRLNTAVLATPKKDIIQSVGRIQRTILNVGDLKPLIIDIADTISVFERYNSLRSQYYRKSKYLIETFYSIDNVIMNQNDYNMSIKLNKIINQVIMLNDIMKIKLVCEDDLYDEDDDLQIHHFDLPIKPNYNYNIFLSYKN